MDSTIRLNRYTQLWQDGVTSVRRIALSGLIFAVLILIKVVEPYQNPTLQELRKTLEGREETEQRVSAELEQMRKFETAMDRIEKMVLAAPWDQANEELNKFFRDSGEHSKAEADRTVRSIASQIHDAVVTPLRTTINNDAVEGDLAAFPDKIEEAIETWKNKKLADNAWYVTSRRKGATIGEVFDILKELRDQASMVIERKRAEVSDQSMDLEREFEEAARLVEESNASIEEEMNEALPTWARKLVPPERMVRFYPWILAGIALYLVGSALVASRHFHGMADEHGWTAEERSDPLLSSYWTLTWRGNVGTAITLAAYSSVLGVLWYCLFRSQQVAGPESALVPLGHGLFALAVIAVWVAAWRRRAVSIA